MEEGLGSLRAEERIAGGARGSACWTAAVGRAFRAFVGGFGCGPATARRGKASAATLPPSHRFSPSSCRWAVDDTQFFLVIVDSPCGSTPALTAKETTQAHFRPLDLVDARERHP
jgi:hypothetical protein